jgi:hypothetical protein
MTELCVVSPSRALGAPDLFGFGFITKPLASLA